MLHFDVDGDWNRVRRHILPERSKSRQGSPDKSTLKKPQQFSSRTSNGNKKKQKSFNSGKKEQQNQSNGRVQHISTSRQETVSHKNTQRRLSLCRFPMCSRKPQGNNDFCSAHLPR